MKLDFTSRPHCKSANPACGLRAFAAAAAALPLLAGCIREKPPVPPPAAQAEAINGRKALPGDSLVPLLYAQPKTDTVHVPVKVVRLHRKLAELKMFSDSSLIWRINDYGITSYGLVPEAQKLLPSRITEQADTLKFHAINFNEYSDDTAKSFELISGFGFNKRILAGGAFNFCAFESVITQLERTDSSNVSTTPLLEIVRDRMKPRVSVYFLPHLSARHEGYAITRFQYRESSTEYHPAGRCRGGQLVLGVSYYPLTNRMESGVFLLLEPDAPDSRATQKIRFTAVYSRSDWVSRPSPFYGGSSSSNSSGLKPGLLERECSRYLSQYGYR